MTQFKKSKRSPIVILATLVIALISAFFIDRSEESVSVQSSTADRSAPKNSASTHSKIEASPQPKTASSISSSNHGPIIQDQAKFLVGKTYHCRVVKINDADTINAICPITVQKNGRSNTQELTGRIRVWAIDAPELKQDHWGKDSLKTFYTLLPQQKNGMIEVAVQDIDRYDRLVSQLHYNGQDIGLEMVKDGKAIVLDHFIKDASTKKTYLSAQQNAKNAKIGIWQVPGNQQRPSQWRRENPR